MPSTCHILISEGPEQDAFCEMTYLSVALCKRLYPESTATVLTDESTLANLELLPYQFDRLQVIEIPEELSTGRQRSRYLKTRMRQFVEGDLVFIDADALPLHPFHEICDHGAPFAAALDRNRTSPEPAFPSWVIPHYNRLGWDWSPGDYFNSGVMFMADTPQMAEFSERWHGHWRRMLEECGVPQDQPSLNHTLGEMGIAPHKLPVRFNAMVDASPYLARGARIVHYFLRGDGQPDPLSLLSHLIRHLRETGGVDWEAVEHAARTSDAWIHPTSSVHIELATRHPFHAFRIAASRALQRQ